MEIFLLSSQCGFYGLNLNGWTMSVSGRARALVCRTRARLGQKNSARSTLYLCVGRSGWEKYSWWRREEYLCASSASRRGGQCDNVPSLQMSMCSDCHTNKPRSLALRSECRLGTPYTWVQGRMGRLLSPFTTLTRVSPSSYHWQCLLTSHT